MTCLACRQGETAPGFTTVTLERDGRALVFERVPAQVCLVCGEAYVDEEVTVWLLADAEARVEAGQRQQAIVQLFGTVEYDPGYDYKAQRCR